MVVQICGQILVQTVRFSVLLVLIVQQVSRNYLVAAGNDFLSPKKFHFGSTELPVINIILKSYFWILRNYCPKGSTDEKRKFLDRLFERVQYHRTFPHCVCDVEIITIVQISK